MIFTVGLVSVIGLTNPALAADATLKGSIKDRVGTAVDGVQIHIINSSNQVVTIGSSGVDGLFSVTAPPDSYTVRLIGNSKQGTILPHNFSISVTIDLTQGDVTQDLVIEAEKVNFRVYDPLHVPVDTLDRSVFTPYTIVAEGSGSYPNLFPGAIVTDTSFSNTATTFSGLTQFAEQVVLKGIGGTLRGDPDDPKRGYEGFSNINFSPQLIDVDRNSSIPVAVTSHHRFVSGSVKDRYGSPVQINNSLFYNELGQELYTMGTSFSSGTGTNSNGIYRVTPPEPGIYTLKMSGSKTQATDVPPNFTTETRVDLTNGDITRDFVIGSAGQLIIAGPATVNAVSPTNMAPVLSWAAIAGSDHYDIYRNGVKIGVTSSTSFTDSSLTADGAYDYTFRAVDAGGASGNESFAKLVIYDTTLPSISSFRLPAANSNGWNNTDVTVTFQCSDSLSGIESCTSPVTLGTEGYEQSVSGFARDKAGNAASRTKGSIWIDKTAPILQNLRLSSGKVSYGESATVAVDPSDNLSGFASKGEYFIGDDPGYGNGNLMDYIGSSYTANLGLLPSGVHRISVRTKDFADNWSIISIIELTVLPDAPTDLSGLTPVNTFPALTWNSAGGADHYDIYRNGIKVGTSSSTNFTDTGLSTSGSYIYTVAAVNLKGDSGPQSTSKTIVFDTAKPIITATVSPLPNADGWNNTAVTVTYTCTDSLSGVAICSMPVTLSAEGANQSVAGTSTDNAGNSHTLTVAINIDKTASTVGVPTFSSAVKTQTETVTISSAASDMLSGVAGGEYYVDVDPGLGNGIPMTASDGNIVGTIGPGLEAGSHTIGVRSKDRAGNWSNVETATLVVLPL